MPAARDTAQQAADDHEPPANSSLQQALAEIQAIYDQSPIGMLQLDTDLRYLRVNGQMAAINGVPAADHIGKTLAEIVPDLAPKIEAACRRVIETGEPVIDIEITGLTAADPGVEHTWRESWFPLRDLSGQIVGLNIVAQDITERKRATEALREREQFVSGILGSISDAFMTLDRNWRFTFVGRGVEERFGMRDQDILGRSVWELFPDAVDNPAYTALHRAMAERISVEYEFFYEPWQQWLFDKAYPLDDGGLAILSRDVTERKLADERVRRSTELLNVLIDRSPTGFYIVNADFRIAIINADSQARAFRNVAPAVGRRLDEAMRILWPEPLATEIINIFRHTLDTGEGYRSPGLISERNDIDTVETYEWQLERITMADGTYGIVCYYYDTTRLLEAEMDLRESEERFRAMADNIPQLAWMAEPGTEGQATWFNRAWLEYTGTTLEQNQGAGWHAAHHPDHAEAVIRRFEHHVKECLEWEDTFPLRGKDGRYRWFLSRMNVIRDEAGKAVRIFGTNTDITELRETQEALRDADRRKDEFLAILAHELRNPLAPIVNSLGIMRRTGIPDPGVLRLAEMMERQVTHMVRLVDDLMEVSRISRGKIELRRELVDVASVIRSAVDTSRPSIEAGNHQLTLQIPAEPLTMQGDFVRLTQVVANLLNNAAKFTESGGQITVTVDHDGDGVAIAVRDTGQGIPPDMLPHVFDLFMQVERDGGRTQGGLGIGLTLVRSLAELHGGSVQARSGGIGAGSEFVVRLPLGPAGVAKALQERTAGSPAVFAARRILVVDDNRDSAESLGMLLTLLGAEVQVAYSGLEALTTVAAFRPAVVLLDIGMPDMDGHEVARRISGQAEFRDVTLIALTGWGQKDALERSSAAGFDHHLVKPVDVDALQGLLLSLEGRG